MLTIEDLTLTTKHHRILSHINLKFQENHVYGIIGPNGVGKTTLFKSILGITKYQGKILLNQHPVNDLEIGKLIEYPNFYKELTVSQNLQLFAQYMHIGDQAISQALKRVDLWKVKDKRFADLSLGTKQRLGIARALLGHHKLLLLDEPQNGLDPLGIKSIRELLNDVNLRHHRIILMASHNLNEITKIVDDLIFVDDGKILCQINNQNNAYYLFKGQFPYFQATVFDKDQRSSTIKETPFILTTWSQKQFQTKYPRLQCDYIGHIDNLESLFDFVITKEVTQNVYTD
jgi:ABC-type multidrug transport system ATPase subunit